MISRQLNPGEQLDFAVMLRENFEMKLVGTYSVVAEANFFTAGDPKNIHSVSNTVTVEVR